MLSHIRLLTVVCSLAAASVAGADDDLRARVAECQQIDSVLSRLECFDRLPPMESAGPAPRPEPTDAPERPDRADEIRVAPRPAPVQPSPPSQRQPRPEQTTEPAPEFPFTATITEVRRLNDGLLVFRLDNGTTWIENEASGLKFETGQRARVEVRRFLFETTWMEIGNYEFKVRRLDR